MVGTFVDSLRRASEFFAERGEIYAALDKIERVLSEENIDFAVIGGMALNFHGYRHVTNDVDVLTTPEGLRAIHQRLAGDDYRIEGVRNLRDVQNDVVIDILVREGPIDCADFEGHRSSRSRSSSSSNSPPASRLAVESKSSPMSRS
jgi:hypothetical protein